MRNLDPYPLKDLTLADQNTRVENGQIDLLYSSLLALGFIFLLQPNWVIGVLLFFCIRFVYYFIFEWFYQKTPGKWQTQTMVLSHGHKPKLLQLVIRNGFRFIAGFSMIDDHPTFLHDKLSKTQVVVDELHPQKPVIPSKKFLKKFNKSVPVILYIVTASYVLDQDQLDWIDIINLIIALLLIMVFLRDLIKWYRSKS